MIKVLFIGNSFSEDATRYIEAIAGEELFVRNLCIGGCSLEIHANNVRTGAEVYDYQKDAASIRKFSLQEALEAEAWDYVSIQQVSSYSGMVETYEPHIKTVLDCIKERCPGAKTVFHRTWSYDNGSQHPDFSNYGCDSELMWTRIQQATNMISEKYSLPIIPSGDAVAAARRLPEFDLKNGVVPLTRDSFHLSLDYGRYLLGLVLYKFFTGKSPLGVEFAPEKCDTGIVEKLKKIVDAIDF